MKERNTKYTVTIEMSKKKSKFSVLKSILDIFNTKKNPMWIDGVDQHRYLKRR